MYAILLYLTNNNNMVVHKKMKKTVVNEKWFRDICEHADNMADAARKTGLHPTTFRSVAKRLGCYKPNQSNRPAYIPHAYSKEDVERLFLSNEREINVPSLRKLLIKHGFKKPICEICGIDTWMNKPVPLELHHIDGDRYNNHLGNLQILCPTCHAQLTNGSNVSKRKIHKEFIQGKEQKHITRVAKRIEKRCPICGSSFVVKSSESDIRHYCSYECSHRASHRFEISAGALLDILKETPNYTKVGEQLGVSANAVKKRCKRLGILDEVQQFIDAEKIVRINVLRSAK